MQLKRVTLHGFKSFADKTHFDFGDGIAVVVGPNGCGKSNIVDAIKWVLGEQSAKSLRGGNMQDVIFSGSNSRPGMGMAEVALTFTNTRALLDTEEDEVTVSRKLYRSGESEYLLNKKPCRLKDVRELFMDTGIGADAYSIIEQGKVAVLLQASKQDRRAIFEEAAGISKYKARKREALRKLERTEQNVLRLTDIIAEVERRLRSIKYQAGKARNYQTYAARLKELRLQQFMTEYHQLQKAIVTDQGNLTSGQDELAGVTTTLGQAETRLSVLDDEIQNLAGRVREVENEVLQCTAHIGNQQDRIDLGNRRFKELQDALHTAQQRINQLREQSRRLQEELQENQQEAEEAEGVVAAQQEQLKQLQDVRQQHGLALAEFRAQLEDEKSGLIDIVRRTAHLHNEISSLDLRRNGLTGQKDRLHDRSGKVAAELEELLTEHAQFDRQRAKAVELLDESRATLEDKRRELAAVNRQRADCTDNLSAAKEYRSGLLSRQQLLADMEKDLEGVDQGVRQILQAKAQAGQDPQQDSFYYVRGMVAELLEAEVEYAGIIEAALSQKAQHLVAGSSQAVLEDSANLDSLEGRVRILCLDNLPPFANGYDFSIHPEVQAKLIDLVSFSPENERLAWHLLGKTVLVDTIDSAVRLAQVAPPGYRWVSLKGEILEADGTLHLGPHTGQSGLISRKSELRQLDVSLAEADERITALDNQSQQYGSQAGHLEKNLQELRTVIYEASGKEIELRGRLEQVDQNVKRLNQEQPLIASEMAGLQDQIEETLNLQESSRQDLGELESTNRQRQEHIDALEEKVKQLDAEDQTVADQVTDLKVALGQTQQRRLALRERVSNVQLQMGQLRHDVAGLERDLTNAQDNSRACERSILAAEGKIADLFQSRQESEASVKELRRQRAGLEDEKVRLHEQIVVDRRRHEELQEQVHAVQMSLNENQLRSQNLTTRAHEEVGLDLAEYYRSSQLPAAETPEQVEATPDAQAESTELAAPEQMDWDTVAAEIEDLRGKIERLGNVNLDAITEQEELAQRADYLNTEAHDLRDSQRQLEQLIEKINQQSEAVFRESFERICINFADLFRKLFGGGRAEIVLEDPDDILECGIEIIARPPGKQLQSISLLSGGEKTMAAVALLMAIFKSKPSPFCLLDEVDAALDEANVERFTLVVKEFLEESQFVIITHSRRTMNVADIIYGVTMQEQGVSKKVSVRFVGEDDEPELSAAS